MAEPIDESSRRELVTILERVVKAEHIPAWFDRPNPALGGATPNELLDRGEYEAVAEVVAQLEYPGAT